MQWASFNETRKPKPPGIEKALIKWFMKRSSRNLSISWDKIKVEIKQMNSHVKAISGGLNASSLISLKGDTKYVGWKYKQRISKFIYNIIFKKWWLVVSIGPSKSIIRMKLLELGDCSRDLSTSENTTSKRLYFTNVTRYHKIIPLVLDEAA